MIKSIAKIFAGWKIYKWIQPRIKNFIILFLIIFFTFYIHNEFLNWSEISNSTAYIGISYIVKNLILLLSIIFYLYFNTSIFKKKLIKDRKHDLPVFNTVKDVVKEIETDPSSNFNDEIAEKVTKIIVEHLGIDDMERITEDAKFIDDLEADSLDKVELVMAFEEAFDVEMPDEKAATILTVGDAIKLLKELLEINKN